jgi:hypothetical protein
MRGQSLIRVLIFVPYVIAEVVVGTGFSLMLQTQGAERPAGAGGWAPSPTTGSPDPAIAIWTLMAILTWKYVGFAVILFLAGLQGIPEELYEAAALDGAGYWQTHWRITLPLLAPTPHLGVPVDHRSPAAVRPRLHHLGPVRRLDRGHLHDGHLHGRQRPQRRQLRLRQRRRRRHLRHLARRRPHLPALRAASRHGRRHHRRKKTR